MYVSDDGNGEATQEKPPSCPLECAPCPLGTGGPPLSDFLTVCLSVFGKYVPPLVLLGVVLTMSGWHGTWSGHTLLPLARRLLCTVAGGYLIIDDTVTEKPYARRWGKAAWVWPSKHSKVVFGGSVVLLVWPDGQVRIPLASRCWRKGGPSQGALALELLSSARNRLRCQPQFVLFDAWYPSKKLLQRSRDYGWVVVCQRKKNRRFEGTPLSRYLWQPDWPATGRLSGELQVLVVRYRRKYDATNRLSLSAKEVRTHSIKRQAVEEVIRTRKSHLGLETCQAGYRRLRPDMSRPREGAQEHHVALCMVAYLVVERERLDQGCTWVRLKRHLILTGSRRYCQPWSG